MGSCMSNNSAKTEPQTKNKKSNGDSPAEKKFDFDQQTLADFLKEKNNLDHVWAEMDKDNNGYLDRAEFQHLLQVALSYFCNLRDPDMPRPDDDTMGPFVEKLSAELVPHIDENGDGQITRKEFERFGQYLCQEHKKLKKELEPAS